MNFKTYYNLDDLIRSGKTIADGCTTISFDIFDTLLIRRVFDPDLVKLPVARYISTLAEKQGHHWPWKKVQQLRDSIEQSHREMTGQTFDDHEACYPDFMREMLSVIFGNEKELVETILQHVTDFELEMENSILVPRKLLSDWLIDLHAQGKDIYLLSDIYLPATHLRRLVEHAGLLDHVKDVISSADTFLAKASGHGFRSLQERYQLSRDDWLHIGDNPISDGLRAAEFGIQALVIEDVEEKQRKAINKRQWYYSKHRNYWKGRLLQQLMLPLEAENAPQHPLYVEGYSFLAPLIGAFIQRIMEISREIKIEKIFFLSREGWMFEKCWKSTASILYPGTFLPDTAYLYVSRIALAGASCAYQGLTQTNADIAFLPAGNRDFHDLCRIFSLDLQPLTEHLNNHGLQVDDPLNPSYPGHKARIKSSFSELLADEKFQDEIRRQTRSYNDALQRYLEDLGFFNHSDVALVDIGWLGTIQRFFYDAIKHRSDKPRLHGLLFAATRGIKYPQRPDNSIEGVIYDRNRFDFAASSVTYALDLFEETCRAPHPTLNGYALKGDSYELVFRTEDDTAGQSEKAQSEFYHPLHEGIFDAIPRFATAASLLGCTFNDLRPWLNHVLISKLAFPKASEISTIRHRAHLDDFHGTNKASKKRKKPDKLWEHSQFYLRFNPFIRFKYHLNNAISRLRE